MKSPGLATIALNISVLLGGGIVWAGSQLPDEPPNRFGSGVTPAFEGWFDTLDGNHHFLIGYLNRNRAQEVDVPIGPNNRFDPGGPDVGQPTHFLPGRHAGVFIVTVPQAFSAAQRITWTITVNGQTNSIPFHLVPDYNVSPLRQDFPPHNTPPVLRLFDDRGPGIQGPLAALATASVRTISVSSPLNLPLWADDDAQYASGTGAPMTRARPPVTLTWSPYRGPGKVTFDKPSPALEPLKGGGVGVPYSGKSTAVAHFSLPGEYVLHVLANDYSGAGGGAGEVCCWTTALVKVLVNP